MCQPVSIPAGFTQCRWSTSRVPPSLLQIVPEELLFLFLLHHFTSNPFFSRDKTRHGRVPSVVPLPAECYYPSLHRKICLDSHRPITESMLLKILDTFYLRAKAYESIFS
uniref:Uncharacterized protein n=1 Tax=Xiphophorus couchianus TaxID=32473 RepID=A0A3B5M1H9_9TELE